MSSFNIYLNSKNLDLSFNDSKKSDVRFIINSAVNIDLDQEALSVKLNHFNCSNTFYNVTSKKNTISINKITQTIPEGNYAIEDLLDYLNTAYLNKYVFTYNDVTQKVMIAANNAYLIIDSTNNILRINNRQVTIPNGEYTPATLVSYLNTLTEFKSGASAIYSFSANASNELNVAALSNVNRMYLPPNSAAVLFRYQDLGYPNTFDIGYMIFTSSGGWYSVSEFFTEINAKFQLRMGEVRPTLPNTAVRMEYIESNTRFRFVVDNYMNYEDVGYPPLRIQAQNFTFLGFTGEENEITYVGTTKYITATEKIPFFKAVVLGKTIPTVYTTQTIPNPVTTINRFENLDGTCLKLLGFESTSTGDNSTSIVSPYVYNLNTSQHMYVKSNFQVANIASYDKRSGYVLAYVPLGAFDSVVAYQNYSSAFLKTDTKNINYIDIKITDDEDNEVDFKNHNWSLSLEFLVEKLF